MLTDFKNEIKKAINDSKEELKDEIKDIKVRLEVIEQENHEIKEEVSEARYENEILRNRIQQLEEYSRIENIVIHGIEEEENETEDDLVAQIQEIGKSLGVNIEKYDISTCHRLPTNKKESVPPTIVRMNNRHKKEKMIKRSKECRLENIYIDRHLTRMTAELYKEVRQKKKEGKFEFAWINKRNQVFIRETAATQAIKIENKERLQEAVKQIEEKEGTITRARKQREEASTAGNTKASSSSTAITQKAKKVK